MTRTEIQQELRSIFGVYLGASATVTQGLVPESVSQGKLYEAYVLAQVVQHLAMDEGFSLTLVGGTKIKLKSSPGPINRNYPRIELRRSGLLVAELWTDVEFLTLSYALRGSGPVTKGDYHESDILIVEAGVSGRPAHDRIWLGVECKNTGYEKGLLKEILGIRRELSLLQPGQTTKFVNWPRSTVPAMPPVCLVVYSTDINVGEYGAPGGVYGIDFIHYLM
jgi:hypothetical protein